MAEKSRNFQELQLSYVKLKDEMVQLLNEKMQNSSESMNFRSYIEKILEENDR